MKTTSLEHTYSEQFASLASNNITLVDLILQLVKDSMLLKSGIVVYFKHLVPFFSKISHFSKEEYTQFKKFILNDIVNNVKKNQDKLTKIYEVLNFKLKKENEIPLYIDLGELRSNIESEISLPLFNFAFSERDIDIKDQFQFQNQYGYTLYLKAIKDLEKRLYSNYNLIVIAYLKSL